jgi:hypothetical protein
MLTQENAPVAQSGDQSSGALAVRSTYVASALAGVQAAQAGAAPRLSFFINRPEVDAGSLSALIIKNDWLRAGDIIHVAEIRRHTLTDADLDAAAHVVIGGAQ